jgi:hypothetical protein
MKYIKFIVDVNVLIRFDVSVFFFLWYAFYVASMQSKLTKKNKENV